MTIFQSMGMPMGFVILLPFSTSFSDLENDVMHPVRGVQQTQRFAFDLDSLNQLHPLKSDHIFYNRLYLQRGLK